MRLEHHDSSGLYPGRFTQTLRWRKGGRFELFGVPRSCLPEVRPSSGRFGTTVAEHAAGRSLFGLYRNPFTDEPAVQNINRTLANTAPAKRTALACGAFKLVSSASNRDQ